MAKLAISIFTLNQGFPQLFDRKGEALLAFRSVRSNGEYELFEADLKDGAYYLVNDECDTGEDSLGEVTHRTLERVVVSGGQVVRDLIAKTGQPAGDVPASVAESFNATIGGPLASW